MSCRYTVSGEYKCNNSDAKAVVPNSGSMALASIDKNATSFGKWASVEHFKMQNPNQAKKSVQHTFKNMPKQARDPNLSAGGNMQGSHIPTQNLKFDPYQ